MKKIFKTLSASVLMALALTACQKEEFGGNEAEGIYTFEVSADNIATKAAIDRDGNGTDVNRFIMEVYLAKTTGELVLLDRQVKAPTAASPKSTSFNLTLIKDQEYKVLFWADKGTDAMEDLYYKTDNLQNVSFLDAARTGNNDALDAFSKMEVITRAESKAGFSKSVQLTRPFGQVNFITTDIPAIRALSGGSQFLPTDVKVSYTTCTGFNVLTQTGTGSEDIEYTAHVYSTTNPATDPAKYTLSMDYMLTVNADKETRNVVKLTALANGYELTTVEVTNYPVQRNYRTNIIGNLLTTTNEFVVEVDPMWLDPENDQYIAATVAGQPYTSIEAAFENATNGETIILANDVETAGITVPAGATTILNLAGKTITAAPQTRSANGEIALTVLGELTIIGEGTVDGGEGGDNVAVCVKTGGKAIINGGYFTVGADANGLGNSCIYTIGGDVVINGGYFRTEAAYRDFYYVLNQNNGNPGTIQVTGGKFENYNPTRGDDNLLGTFIASGYTSTKISDNPVVYEVGPAPAVTVATAAELKTMLTNLTSAGAGDNVVELTADIQLAEGESWEPITVHGYEGADVITVKGNGHTISGLNAPLFAGGFAGSSGIAIKDLTLDKVNINDTANTLGIGAFVGSVDSMDIIELSNCKLTNSTIVSTAGARVGGLIGWTAGYDNPNDGPVGLTVKVENCVVDNCSITAAGSVGGIIGHAGNNPATYHTIQGCEVKNCTLHSTDDGGWRVGVVVGTANVGKVTISNITESDNTLSQVDKTAPEHSNLYGRFVPYDTGKLTIDGVSITQ